MKIGLLVDQMSLTLWQSLALSQCERDTEFVVYNCTNSPRSRRRLRHYPYYLLNLLSLRMDLTKLVALPLALNVVKKTDFQSAVNGSWQRLPPALLRQIRADNPAVVLKFGMGLLRLPDTLRTPILSYHHGDPRRFRGRPAGFYELLKGERKLGQIIQILSNRLDAGRVVAYAETPVHPHSYRTTMQVAYSVSPLLLGKALQAVMGGKFLNVTAGQTVFTLPSAWTVLRFVVQRLAAIARRLFYGAFFEKKWQVAEAQFRFDGPSSLYSFPPRAEWQSSKCPKGYSFLADPFPNPNGGGMLVEAMHAASGLGQVLELGSRRSSILLAGSGHYSYPATVNEGRSTFLIPESCQWSQPQIFRLTESGVEHVGLLDLDPPVRLVDPTFLRNQGNLFLFGNSYVEGDHILRLWFAERLQGRFIEHPRSPILISPRGSRMGGLCINKDSLYRIGQDGSTGYGDGIILFRIEELSPLAYQEIEVGELRFSDPHGPHTLNLDGERVLFDFYENRFAPMAGIRRLKNRLASSRD